MEVFTFERKTLLERLSQACSVPVYLSQVQSVVLLGISSFIIYPHGLALLLELKADSWNYENNGFQAICGIYHNDKLFGKEIVFQKLLKRQRINTFAPLCIPFVIESSISLQEPAKPLHTDDEMPLYVLSIQERAEQLASQFEGKPVGPQVKFLY